MYHTLDAIRHVLSVHIYLKVISSNYLVHLFSWTPTPLASEMEIQSELTVNPPCLCGPVVSGRQRGETGREEKKMPSSAYRDAIPFDVQMRSGTQLHSSFSELFYIVKPTDSNEC